MKPLTPAQIAADQALGRQIMARFPTDTAAPKQCANDEVRYTGHVGDGGLQGHSVGALYPFMVYGQETAEGTRYGVKDTCGDFDTGPRFTCAEAYTVAEFNATAKHDKPLPEDVGVAFRAIVRKYSEAAPC